MAIVTLILFFTSVETQFDNCLEIHAARFSPALLNLEASAGSSIFFSDGTYLSFLHSSCKMYQEYYAFIS